MYDVYIVLYITYMCIVYSIYIMAVFMMSTMYTMYRISIRCTMARTAAGCYTLSSLPSRQHTPLSASPHSLSHSQNPATCNTRIVCQLFTYFLLSQYIHCIFRSHSGIGEKKVVERSKKGLLVPKNYGLVLGRKSGLALITFSVFFARKSKFST
jgi:hypothetical protein